MTCQIPLHLIAAQLNWQEMTLGALTAKAGLRPGMKKEIKGPSGPLTPIPTSQLTSSPVSPGQTWSSWDSFALYLSSVIPGDMWNKLVFSPCLKKNKNKNKPSPFWYLLKGIKKPHFLNGLLLLQIYVKLGIDFFNFLSPLPPHTPRVRTKSK